MPCSTVNKNRLFNFVTASSALADCLSNATISSIFFNESIEQEMLEEGIIEDYTPLQEPVADEEDTEVMDML